MGIDAGPLREIHAFVYRAPFPNGLTEYEYDHVFAAPYDGEASFDSGEVEEVRWVRLEDLMRDVETHPEDYTPWFLIALKPMADYLMGEKPACSK
jgi:isopentenyl-diphosphate delta-isomerase